MCPDTTLRLAEESGKVIGEIPVKDSNSLSGGWKMRTSHSLVLGLLALLAVNHWATQPVFAGYIYVTDNGDNKIYRANADGSNLIELLSVGDFPYGLAVDQANEKVYWADMATGQIHRADLDGSNMADVIPVKDPSHLALNTSEGKIYWTRNPSGDADDAVERADLDGSNRQVLVTGISFPRGIAIAEGLGKVYWADSNGINRANLDGSGIEGILTGSGVFSDIELDEKRSKIYYGQSGEIRRANFDGTDVEVVAVGGGRGIALDLTHDKIYWLDKENAPYGAWRWLIQRSNLDGSGQELLFEMASNSYLIDIDYVVPEPTTLSILAFGILALLRRRRS
ncbi:hypothetical protein LCGC14_1889230 [marine sediment metagenome]|uniref:Uncharacterized protein n=1 Tax=marine sediment metagenome TaxID=412755 RepID=A0A0F9FZX8_9ZZZZ